MSIAAAAVATGSWFAYQRIAQHIRVAEVERCAEERLAACLADIAERSAVSHNAGQFRDSIAKDLAAAGKMEAARDIARGVTEPTQIDSVQQRIAIASIVAEARANPDRPASFDQLEGLRDVYRYPGSPNRRLVFAYQFLALELAGDWSYGSGSTQTINNAVTLARAKRTPVQSPTLDAALKRLSDVAAAAPAAEQSRSHESLGTALAAAGRFEQARDAFLKVERGPLQGDAVGVSIFRGWLSIQEFAKAREWATRGGAVGVRMRAELSTSLLKAERPDDARKVIDEAWQAGVSGRLRSRELDLFRWLVALTNKLGDHPLALLRAEELLRMASESAYKDEFAFVAAAAAFNELGESERAKDILAQIATRFPPPADKISFGIFSSRLSYQGFEGLADDLLVEIAAETYLAGDEAGAVALLKRVYLQPKGYRAWRWILHARLDCGRIVQTVQQLIAWAGEEAKFGLLVEASAECIKRNAPAAAADALQQAITVAATSDTGGETSLDAAWLANAVGRRDLTKKALRLAASRAAAVQDNDRRVSFLSNVAAVASHLLTGD